MACIQQVNDGAVSGQTSAKATDKLEGKCVFPSWECALFWSLPKTGSGTMVWLGGWPSALGSRADKALLPQMWERLYRIQKCFVFFLRWSICYAFLKALTVVIEPAPQSCTKQALWPTRPGTTIRSGTSWTWFSFYKLKMENIPVIPFMIWPFL